LIKSLRPTRVLSLPHKFKKQALAVLVGCVKYFTFLKSLKAQHN
jgi:hypothetical protein